MRDPNRIEPILAELRRIWTACPDLRLGQIIVNAVRPGEPCPRVFFFEDDKMLAALKATSTTGWVQPVSQPAVIGAATGDVE